jgi:transposase-like protein
VGFQAGAHESAQNWRDLLADLKGRGLTIAPEIAVGDGALGFWKAVDEVWPVMRHQRCWVHKTANILYKLPKAIHPAAKEDLRKVWQGETRVDAEMTMATFAEKYGIKYHKASACLTKDREALLAFVDFLAQHWNHSAHRQPDRERLRHRETPHRPHQGPALAEEVEAHGLHPDPGRLRELAPPVGRKPVALGRQRYQVHGRHRHQ